MSLKREEIRVLDPLGLELEPVVCYAVIWVSNSGSLEEQPVCLTTAEQSLQLDRLVFIFNHLCISKA